MADLSNADKEFLRGLDADKNPDAYELTQEYGYMLKKNKKWNPQTQEMGYADPDKLWYEPFTEEGGGLDLLKGEVKQVAGNVKDVFFDAPINAATKIAHSVSEWGGLGLVKGGWLEEKDFIDFNNKMIKFKKELKTGDGPFAYGADNQLAGTITEVVSQWVVPGVGYYKLFDKLLKIPGLRGMFVKSLAAEPFLVGTVMPSDEANFASWIKDIFKLSDQETDNAVAEVITYLGTPNKNETADAVLENKLKGLGADAPLGLLAPILIGFVKLGMKAVGNMKLLKNQSNTSNISSESPLSGKSTAGTTARTTDLNADGPNLEVGIKDDVGSSQTTDLSSGDTDNILSSSSKNNGNASLNFSIPNKVYHKTNNLEELLKIHNDTFAANQKKIAEVFDLKVIKYIDDSGGKQMETFGRVKDGESIRDKMIVKGREPSNLSDLQGHRILVNGTFKQANKKIQDEIIPKLKENFEVLDIEHKAHIGSYHAQIVNPNNPSTTLEIQIRAGKINKVIDESHIPYAERKKYTDEEWSEDLLRALRNKAETTIVAWKVDFVTGAKKLKRKITGTLGTGVGVLAPKAVGETGEEDK